MRRALATGTSPRSRAIIPKPLLCSSRSVTFKTCPNRDSQRWPSGLSPQLLFPGNSSAREFVLPSADGGLREGNFSPHRTHSKRLISMPASAADAGSNVSLASTSAQTSPRSVARASAKSNTLVRPEEAVPQISVRQPRARPPVSVSSCAMPLETISGVARISRREAGTTAANLGLVPIRAEISAAFLMIFAAVGRGETEETAEEKIKWRPVAADEKTGEADILSRNCQGTQRACGPRWRIRFLFANCSISFWLAIVKLVLVDWRRDVRASVGAGRGRSGPQRHRLS